MSYDVEKMTKQAASTAGLTLAHAMNKKQWASAVRRIQADMCFYLIAHRAGDTGIQANIWIAPPDAPDDGLDSLGFGLCINAGSAYEEFDRYFERLCLKLECLRSNESSLADVVRHELSKERGTTQRGMDYRKDVALYEKIEEHGPRCWKDYQHRFADLVSKKAKYDVLQADVTTELVPTLMVSQEFLGLIAEWKGESRFPEKFLVPVLGARLARLLYINTIAPSS